MGEIHPEAPVWHGTLPVTERVQEMGDETGMGLELQHARFTVEGC